MRLFSALYDLNDLMLHWLRHRHTALGLLGFAESSLGPDSARCDAGAHVHYSPVAGLVVCHPDTPPDTPPGIRGRRAAWFFDRSPSLRSGRATGGAPMEAHLRRSIDWIGWVLIALILVVLIIKL